jgi:Uma2 family endonuclease
MTLAQYLELDRSSERRWEYVDGAVFVIAASPEHNLVKGRIYRALAQALTGKPCLAFPDGQKISTRVTRAYHYPDVSLVCGPVQRDPDDDHAIENPTLLVEVLSPTTADYDRGGKFVHYRSLVSLREYLVVSVETRIVERHRRLESGEWLMTEFATGAVELSSLDVLLGVEELWLDLERLDPAH